VYDVLIKNGTIIDGSGKALYKADMAIMGDHIVRIGNEFSSDEAERVIDAKGLIVAPGFIDMHSHSDLTLFFEGGAESSLYQGVTTEVIGNCGFSGYPVHPERVSMLETYLGGIGYDGSYPIPWKDFDGYASQLEERGIGVNVVSLVGHGSIRIAVMGFDAREATEPEKEQMGRLLQEALDQGVFGMSSGLVYPPGINSPASEFEQLCKIVAKADGLYSTHLRGDGLRAGPTLVESLDEALDVMRATGVSLQVSHVAAKFPNNGAADRVVEKMEQARQDGFRIGCDLHPYMAAMTFLASLMPPWFFEGDTKQWMMRLRDQGERAKIQKALRGQFDHLGWNEFWSRTEAVPSDPSSPYSRKRFTELAKTSGKDPSEVVLDMLCSEGEDLFKALIVWWIYTPEDTLRSEHGRGRCRIHVRRCRERAAEPSSQGVGNVSSSVEAILERRQKCVRGGDGAEDDLASRGHGRVERQRDPCRGHEGRCCHLRLRQVCRQMYLRGSSTIRRGSALGPCKRCQGNRRRKTHRSEGR